MKPANLISILQPSCSRCRCRGCCRGCSLASLLASEIGLDGKIQTFTQLQQSFSKLIQLVQGKIHPYYFCVVALVAVVILQKILRNTFLSVFFYKNFFACLFLGNVKYRPYAKARGTLDMPNAANPDYDSRIGCNHFAHWSKRQAHRL